MPTKTTVSEKSRHSPLSMDLAIAKLLDASKLIACREGVSSNEEKRVQWAFDLLEKPPTGSLVRTMERRSHYRQFVRQAKKQGGLELVALCAAGLGQTSITAMRERDRLLLPSELSKYKDVYQSDVFHDIVKSYFARMFRYHTSAYFLAKEIGRKNCISRAVAHG